MRFAKKQIQSARILTMFLNNFTNDLEFKNFISVSTLSTCTKVFATVTFYSWTIPPFVFIWGHRIFWPWDNITLNSWQCWTGVNCLRLSFLSHSLTHFMYVCVSYVQIVIGLLIQYSSSSEVLGGNHDKPNLSIEAFFQQITCLLFSNAPCLFT